jgi:hypothetical protein
LDRTGTPQVYLPFEGDATLSIILSNAFLLAEDKAIKDPLILRQLGERTQVLRQLGSTDLVQGTSFGSR